MIKVDITQLADERTLDIRGISYDIPEFEISRDMLRDFAEDGRLEYSREILDNAEYVFVRGQACYGWACSGVYLSDWADEFCDESDYERWIDAVRQFPIYDLHDLFYGAQLMGCEYEVWHVMDSDPDWMPVAYDEKVEKDFILYKYMGGSHVSIYASDSLTGLVSELRDYDETLGAVVELDSVIERYSEDMGYYLEIPVYLRTCGILPYRTVKAFQKFSRLDDGSIDDDMYTHYRATLEHFYKYQRKNESADSKNRRILMIVHESKRFFPKLPVFKAKDHYVGETLK